MMFLISIFASDYNCLQPNYWQRLVIEGEEDEFIR